MTPENGNHKLGAAAREVAEHASALTKRRRVLAALRIGSRRVLNWLGRDQRRNV